MKRILPVYFRVPLIFFAVFAAMEYFIDSGDRPAFIKYPLVSVFLFVFLFLQIAIEMTISAVDKVTYSLLTEEQKKKVDDMNELPIGETEWYKNMMNAITKTPPMEEEHTLLLDHNYDGIKELDNNLPPWWVYLFYACIVFAGIYLVKYEMMGGDTPEMELQKEVAQAKIDVENYMKTAPDLMNESKVTLLTDAAALSKGKTIFTNNCAACHRADGGGQIGPNLTDDAWILGGGIKNVFHTISNGGRDGKGMVAWKATLKPKEIQHVASYIISLKGSNPANGKAAEGDVYVETASASAPTADAAAKTETTTVKADSTATQK